MKAWRTFHLLGSHFCLQSRFLLVFLSIAFNQTPSESWILFVSALEPQSISALLIKQSSVCVVNYTVHICNLERLWLVYLHFVTFCVKNFK